MTVTSELVSVNPLTNKSLVDEVLWGRLVGRVEHDREFQYLFGGKSADEQREIAASIMDQAIGFLVVVADSGSDGPYSPSEHVDIGWHAFLMYTREYADFCQRIAGRMIHHAPSDVPSVDYGTGNIIRTVAAMQVRGLFVDKELWPSAADCGYCTGDSCSGSTCNGE